MTSVWAPAHIKQLSITDTMRIPAIEKLDRAGLCDQRIYWDMWPIQDRDGSIADCGGRELWMALSAIDRGDPALRHFEAKIRLLERAAGQWTDLGDVLPDQIVPYEREWAGSAVKTGQTVHLFFTAAGVATKPGGYQQALFQSHAELAADGLPVDWSTPEPCLTGASPQYQLADAHEGEAGKIKAFRDPAFFRDPADGAEYLVFTASLANASSDFNGAMGIAKREKQGWSLCPPLIHADGVNNELERAHLVHHQGRYYAFWATQRGTFAPELRNAPNGLYGMVADTLFGDYRPLNGSGLVMANPEQDPFQTYSWFVTNELVVSSFVDFWGLKGGDVPSDPVEANTRFGGSPAPLLQLAIDGDRCELVGTVKT